jgi:two-component system, cell cycle sensor histidine kinase and response regulator CckA
MQNPDTDFIADAAPTAAPVAVIVDDDDSVRQLLARLLTKGGYRVLQAENGEEALDVIRRTVTPVEVVITDMHMPRMDGETFAGALRHERPHVALVFISGQPPDAVFEATLGAGRAAFLSKPFSREALEIAIADARDIAKDLQY